MRSFICGLAAVVLVGCLQQVEAANTFYAENDGAGFFDFNINTSWYGGVGLGLQLESDEGHTGAIRLVSSADIHWDSTVNSNDMTISFDNFSWTATAQESSSIILSKWNPPAGGFGGSEGYWEYTEPIPYDFSFTFNCTSDYSGTRSISTVEPFDFDGPSAAFTSGFVSGSLTIGTDNVSFDSSNVLSGVHISGGTFDDTDFPTSLTMNLSHISLEVATYTPLYTGQLGGYSVVIVPEPSTITLLLCGLTSLLCWRPRK